MPATINATTASGIVLIPDNSGLLELQSAGTAGAIISANGIGLGSQVSSSGMGIKFPATQVPSSDANTLDDYEEGTWTPAFQTQGGSVSINTSTRDGIYTKVGNTVTVFCYAQVSSISSPTGRFWITGLPFSTARAFTGTMQHEATSGSTPRLIPTCGGGDTRMNIQGQGAGGTTDYASLVVANAMFFVSLTYTTST